MKQVARLGVELSVEERNLLSVAYKNVIGAQRSAWRIISSIEQKEENKGDTSKLELTKQYRHAVSFELISVVALLITCTGTNVVTRAGNNTVLGSLVVDQEISFDRLSLDI